MSGTVCCYAGCKRSYSTDKDVAFFKFPDDPKKRKKWMENSGNPDMESLPERQLRRQRICSDHFTAKSFKSSKTDLLDSAVPIVAKGGDESAGDEAPTKKRKQDETPEVAKAKATISIARKDDHVTGKSEVSSPKKQAGKKTPVEQETPVSFPERQTRRQKAEFLTPTSVKTQESKTDDSPVPVDAKEVDAIEETPNKRRKQTHETHTAAKISISRRDSKDDHVARKSEVPPVDDNDAVESPTKKRKQANEITETAKNDQIAEVSSPKKQPVGKKTQVAPPTTMNLSERRRQRLGPDHVTAKSDKKSDTNLEGVAKGVDENSADETLAPTPTKKRKQANQTPEASKAKKDSKIDAITPGKTEVSQPTKLLAEKKTKAVTNPTPTRGKATEKLSAKRKSDVNSTRRPKVVDDVPAATVESHVYDEYLYFERDFDETYYDNDDDSSLDREFERFYASLKQFLRLSGKWTMGGVQWDPQGRRKVIIISEPEIPPHGRPSVKRCLQFFEDKAIRVFIDGMDMTDVFGLTCYAEKEDVAALICRVAEASSCSGVPEMVQDDLAYFPKARKRNTSYFDADCPGVIPNDSYDLMCSNCRHLQELVMQSRNQERQRLLQRRIRSQEKQFQHPFGKALYSMFSDLVDETDPSKPRKKRTKETFFRKYLHDTRYKMDVDGARTERVYIEKPISVDSVSASFQDIVSKLGFNMSNSKKSKSIGGPRPMSMTGPSTSTPKPRVFPGASGMRMERKQTPLMDQILPFSASNNFTLDDGQEYELIGEVDSMGMGMGTEIVEMKPNPSQQYEIIEVDDETLAKLASSKNSVVVMPDSAPSNVQVTRIDANDPNLSQILKAINTSHGYK